MRAKGNKGGKDAGKERTARDKGKGIIHLEKRPPLREGKGPRDRLRGAVSEISTSGKGQKPYYSDSAAIAAVGERMPQEATVWSWNNWQDNTQTNSSWWHDV